MIFYRPIDNVPDKFYSYKCKVLSLGAQVSIVNTYSMSYPDGIHLFIRVEEEKDQDVKIVHKANRSL